MNCSRQKTDESESPVHLHTKYLEAGKKAVRGLKTDLFEPVFLTHQSTKPVAARLTHREDVSSTGLLAPQSKTCWLWIISKGSNFYSWDGPRKTGFWCFTHFLPKEHKVQQWDFGQIWEVFWKENHCILFLDNSCAKDSYLGKLFVTCIFKMWYWKNAI